MMTADQPHRTRSIQLVFFWTGVVMVLGCVALVAAKNTSLNFVVENTPLISALFGVAIFEFVAAEICHLADARDHREQNETPIAFPRQTFRA
jgi:hypothetical protein